MRDYRLRIARDDREVVDRIVQMVVVNNYEGL